MGVRSGDRGGNAVGPQRPIHLPAYVVFNHCRTCYIQCAGAPQCWNHNFSLRGTSSSSPGRSFRKLIILLSGQPVGWQIGAHCSLGYFEPRRWRWHVTHVRR
jgi:hypothetical protein